MGTGSAGVEDRVKRRVLRKWNQTIWWGLAALAVLSDLWVIVLPSLAGSEPPDVPTAFVAGLLSGVVFAGLVVALTRD